MQSTTVPYFLIQFIWSIITKSAIPHSIASNYTTTSLLIQQSMNSTPSYYINNTTSYDDRPPTAGGPPPMRTPGAARRTLNQLPKTMNSVLLYCFSVFAICVTDIHPKTHKPRGRASDVSTISTCFFLLFLTWFTAHSPTNLCEKGWGYHCSVLVWLLAFLLN